jgi:Heparinase II/III-like protein/Heparinase II/III N-terminus
MRLITLIRRAARKPPHIAVRRAWMMTTTAVARRTAVRSATRFTESRLLAACGATSIDELWERLSAQPHAAVTAAMGPERCGHICSSDISRIVVAAERALERRVQLLGSVEVALGHPVNWSRDFKSGVEWPMDEHGRFDYNDFDNPSDVKIPWELSRLQWLIPAGQGFLINGDERLARGVRDILDEWIDGNPYGASINWSVAMEAAMRAFTWTWFFHVFSRSEAWKDAGFRSRFLRTLYLHGRFINRNIEWSDVNGNHYAADAAGLVFVGLFFGNAGQARKWALHGWRILTRELPRQVYPDGVDFEASTAYHRLVCELFLFPALYREKLGLGVTSEYIASLQSMARFAATYSRSDGTSPLWGDADDARALPLGLQPLGDHRYLASLVAAAWGGELVQEIAGPSSEVLWVLGAQAAEAIAERDAPVTGNESRPFFDAGVFIMRSHQDHVFVDCGDVGLAGRGGHGHNDCLSFEAVLAGIHLVSDRGTYVYTGSPSCRNQFRSTVSHNTPRVDGFEQNRIPADLWRLAPDVRPTVREWYEANGIVRLVAAHDGYMRLPNGVRVVREFELERDRHVLTVTDSFEGSGVHEVIVPFHLAIGVTVGSIGRGVVDVRARGRSFVIRWADTVGWQARASPTSVSPSYGVKVKTTCIEFWRHGELAPLEVVIAPVESVEPPHEQALRLA